MLKWFRAFRRGKNLKKKTKDHVTTEAQILHMEQWGPHPWPDGMCIWNQVISTRKENPPGSHLAPTLPSPPQASRFPLSYQEESAAVAEVKDTSQAGRATSFLFKEVHTVNPVCRDGACPAPTHLTPTSLATVSQRSGLSIHSSPHSGYALPLPPPPRR